jgi:hypothetical protein
MQTLNSLSTNNHNATMFKLKINKDKDPPIPQRQMFKQNKKINVWHLNEKLHLNDYKETNVTIFDSKKIKTKITSAFGLPKFY